MAWKILCFSLCLFAFVVKPSLHREDAMTQENPVENGEIINHFLQ